IGLLEAVDDIDPVGNLAQRRVALLPQHFLVLGIHRDDPVAVLHHVLRRKIARAVPVCGQAHHRNGVVLAENAPQRIDVGIGHEADYIIAHTGSPRRRAMYVEERICLLHPGKVAEYYKLYETEGMPTQLKHLPHMVVYYSTERGMQNTVIHLWAYDDLNQRDRCRSSMQADAAWQAYVAE